MSEGPAVSDTMASQDAGTRTEGRLRRPGVWKLVTEVTFISLGVFLALLADQWREDRATQALAQSSLRGFRAEIIANRGRVAAVKDYDIALLGNLRAYLKADAATRPTIPVRIQGIQPVFFEQTAWDLAMGTQSLAHLDQDVASSLSRIYGLQRTYLDQTRGMMDAIYLRPLGENYDGLAAYYGDLVLWEPALIRMYDEVLPRIEQELRE